MIDAYFNYQYSNLLGLIIFLTLGWLASKTDIAKDILALLLILLLIVPVPLVMTVHFSKGHWVEFILCGLIQAGLTYACFVFIRYMYRYHKGKKYIIWE